MQNASENIPSGMLTVFCDHKTELKKALRFAREYCIKELKMDDAICSIANYLCTDAKVIAGHEEVRQIIKFCRLLLIFANSLGQARIQAEVRKPVLQHHYEPLARNPDFAAYKQQI